MKMIAEVDKGNLSGLKLIFVPVASEKVTVDIKMDVPGEVTNLCTWASRVMECVEVPRVERSQS